MIFLPTNSLVGFVQANAPNLLVLSESQFRWPFRYRNHPIGIHSIHLLFQRPGNEFLISTLFNIRPNSRRIDWNACNFHSNYFNGWNADELHCIQWYYSHYILPTNKLYRNAIPATMSFYRHYINMPRNSSMNTMLIECNKRSFHLASDSVRYILTHQYILFDFATKQPNFAIWK